MKKALFGHGILVLLAVAALVITGCPKPDGPIDVPVSGISIVDTDGVELTLFHFKQDDTTSTIFAPATTTLRLKFSPSDASNQGATWSVEPADDSIVTISSIPGGGGSW